MGPADDGERRDELAAEATPAHAAAAVVGIAIVLLVAVVAVALAMRPAHHRHRVAPPTPAPALPTVTPSTSPAADIGSVLTDAIGACTHTDHRSRVDVAMSLTNLTSVPLRIVSAAPASAGLQVTALHVGSGHCGDGPSADVARLPPGRDAVVALRFSVGSPCPAYGDVTATLTIDAGGRAVHASTPALANLRALGFAGC